MQEQYGPTGGDPGESSKKDHRSSFLRSNRKEQNCGGLAEMRRHLVAGRNGEDRAEESSGLFSFTALDTQSSSLALRGGVRLGNAAWT